MCVGPLGFCRILLYCIPLQPFGVNVHDQNTVTEEQVAITVPVKNRCFVTHVIHGSFLSRVNTFRWFNPMDQTDDASYYESLKFMKGAHFYVYGKVILWNSNMTFHTFHSLAPPQLRESEKKPLFLQNRVGRFSK